jgi:hypothetical protein
MVTLACPWLRIGRVFSVQVHPHRPRQIVTPCPCVSKQCPLLACPLTALTTDSASTVQGLPSALSLQAPMIAACGRPPASRRAPTQQLAAVVISQDGACVHAALCHLAEHAHGLLRRSDVCK